MFAARQPFIKGLPNGMFSQHDSGCLSVCLSICLSVCLSSQMKFLVIKSGYNIFKKKILITINMLPVGFEPSTCISIQLCITHCTTGPKICQEYGILVFPVLGRGGGGFGRNVGIRGAGEGEWHYHVCASAQMRTS